MTRTFDYTALDTTENPLFAKLRNRFMCQDNCTIGEHMLKRAENDGYKCSSDVSSSVRAKSNFSMTSEYFITRGSSAATAEKQDRATVKKNRNGLIAMLATFILCSFMLAFLVFNRIEYVKNAQEIEDAPADEAIVLVEPVDVSETE